MAFFPMFDGFSEPTGDAEAASLFQVPSGVSRKDGVERIHVLVEQGNVCVRRLANRHGCGGVPRPPPAGLPAELMQPWRCHWLSSSENCRPLTLLTLMPALPVALTFSARLQSLFDFLLRSLDLVQPPHLLLSEEVRAKPDVKAGL